MQRGGKHAFFLSLSLLPSLPWHTRHYLAAVHCRGNRKFPCIGRLKNGGIVLRGRSGCSDMRQYAVLWRMDGRNVVLVTIVRSAVSLSVFQVRLEADVCKVDFLFLASSPRCRQRALITHSHSQIILALLFISGFYSFKHFPKSFFSQIVSLLLGEWQPCRWRNAPSWQDIALLLNQESKKKKKNCYLNWLFQAGKITWCCFKTHSWSDRNFPSGKPHVYSGRRLSVTAK